MGRSCVDEPQVYLTLLTEQELRVDPAPDQPFRLTFSGWWQAVPDGGYRRANFTIRLDSADISALGRQIRGQQIALASRTRRQVEEFAQTEVGSAGAALAARDPGPTEEEIVPLLWRVLVKLREAP